MDHRVAMPVRMTPTMGLELSFNSTTTIRHESSKQQAEPASTFYLINASLPKVGVESIDDYARRANVATTNGIARPALRQSVLKRQPIYHRDLTRHKHQPTFTACTASKGTTDTCGHVSRYNAQLTQNTRQIRIPPSTSTRGRGRNGSSRHTDTAKWVGNTRTTSEHLGPPTQGVHEKGCMLEVPNHEQGAKQNNHPDRHSHALTRDSDHIQDDAPTSHLNIMPHFLAWRLDQLPEDCMKGLFIITERDKPKRKLPKDALRRVATPCHATVFAYIALEANAKPVPSRPKSTSKLSRLAPLSETTAQSVRLRHHLTPRPSMRSMYSPRTMPRHLVWFLDELPKDCIEGSMFCYRKGQSEENDTL
ncbi:hypothetical protein RIF29_02134 [Crotalaria pallida]|uniref:Uncharacterized protein n=1 Tax=Crotalaria pallida TaxID=3830 RepID=A0AAN9P7U9_CROPI